jgi:serine/threonine-protein kinase HipA
MDNNALDFDLAKSVGEYFMLNTKKMEEILTQIISVMAKWRIHANAIGILKKEQEMMQPAFKF